MAEHIWGPGFSEYSIRDFEPRISKISRSEMEASERLYEIPPLSWVETSLRRCDPRVRGTSRMSVDDIADALTGYTRANNFCNVFKNYYGFLCVRYLLHTVCLAALGPTVDVFVRSLPQNASWSDVSSRVAAEALKRAAQVTKNASSFEDYYGIFRGSRFLDFLKDSDAGETYSFFLTGLLWSDRGSFLRLCQKGLLPGSAILLMIALKQPPTNLDEENVGNSTLRVRDLAFRSYLIGSARDRQILRVVCMPAIDRKIPSSSYIEYFFDPQDSRTISQEYVNLLHAWLQDDSDAKCTPTSFTSTLTTFVLQMAIYNPSATPQEHRRMIYTSLRMLWLLFECRGQTSTLDHPGIRTHCVVVVFLLGFVQEICISTAENKYRFLQMLADIEIIGLIGRTLLLVLDERNEPRSMYGFEEILDTLSSQGNIINDSIIAAPELFYDSKIEWAKILAHCNAYKQLLLGDPVRNSSEIRYTTKIISGWLRLAKSLEDDSQAQECAYPRCFQRFSLNIAVHYICGRCNSATYCSVNCQRAHWKITTSESHELACSVSDRPIKDVETG
ncbi:hypothetical protein FRC12_002923 [Ceratobasidium sp. 428]|nr:hypothetical protein FRC12_002923 [Ceratobasidium sp. 428]